MRNLIRKYKTFLTLFSLIFCMICSKAFAEWKEIPLNYNPEKMKVYGHAYASEMPGGEIYIIGRAMLENLGKFDRRIKSAYITVFTEEADGKRINMTVLGEEKKIAPKIVERNGGLAAMSFSGIVRGLPVENLACGLEENSVNSSVICSPRGIVEAEIREDERKNLVLHIKLEEPIECDYDVGWGIIDKNGVLQWYEAGLMLQGDQEASMTILCDLREGFVDDVESIDYAFAELYVHVD